HRDSFWNIHLLGQAGRIQGGSQIGVHASHFSAGWDSFSQRRNAAPKPEPWKQKVRRLGAFCR
ncbi:MAG: hypothetical protein ACJ74Y_19065, partial [Bryobacteraceae bacterium]